MRWFPAALLAPALLAMALSSRAEPPLSDDALFAAGVSALERGATDEAIDDFELLADRGVVHPDISYDRGVAYAKRAASHSARGGDFGRAAAGFREAVLLRPEDDAAAQALERVQHEIARRRARSGAGQIELSPSLRRILTGLLDESTWAVLAAGASLVLTLGLGARLFGKGPRLELAGVVAASLGTLALLVCGGFALLAGRERASTRHAVVIVAEAHLVDDGGATVTGPGSVLPEGASVLVLESRGTRAKVEWGTLEGWMSLGQLRLLSRP